MKEIPISHPSHNTPPVQNFSKLGFAYITVLGLANQVVPHPGSWRPLATAVNYLFRIVPIVYMVFQARPASPVGVQSDSGAKAKARYLSLKEPTKGKIERAQIWAFMTAFYLNMNN
ncbi:hypothetical protein DSO57_1011448 [Entomophthora muscae]|uniref:Uncharacterized protein n=1 Tax=Entomophthora muscae TaxID=34485 RepID=A0ACC2RL09_9FUNG|nr:hypothetical protein DSO57_1011448 [Entomophthora muscae]